MKTLIIATILLALASCGGGDACESFAEVFCATAVRCEMMAATELDACVGATLATVDAAQTACAYSDGELTDRCESSAAGLPGMSCIAYRNELNNAPTSCR